MSRATKAIQPVAMDSTWMQFGSCNGAASELFFPETPDGEELPYPDPRAVALCDRCPVRSECLEWANATNATGTWAGTSTYQREMLKRVRTRRGCPGCCSDLLVFEGRHELCLACGVSWYV